MQKHFWQELCLFQVYPFPLNHCLFISRTEEKYEEHPLIDVFNVYLQIFLSQALEPGFLSAIIEEKGKASLEQQHVKKGA